ncbi:hypothetical protein Tco_0536940 [Tanacetum coccineum]
MGKPVLQPPRNQSVVRQPNAFKSERPNFSKPRFASQVDVNDVLSKPVTPYYLPKVREYVLAKPHHVIAPGSFRNSQEEPYGSNDMAHNHYLEEARKKTQERNRNSKPSVMHTTSLQNTTNGSKPNTRSNNQISRSLPVSKSSCGMSNGVSLVDHSRNSSSFSDSKKCVCSICHKYIFNTNHDDCITKILNKVNSRAKVQSPKIRNNNPVEPKNHTHKPGRQNGIGQRFSLNKSSAVHEKPHTPRSYLRWKPTGRIFKTVSLRWIPTGKVFIDSTTKVDSEPPNGSNDDITNPYECNQTLYVSAGTSNSSAGLVLHLDVVWTKQFKPRSSSNDVWTKQFKPRSSSKDVWINRFKPHTMAEENIPCTEPTREMNKNHHCLNSYDWKGNPSLRSTEVNVLSAITKAEKKLLQGEVHATHARIVSGPDPEPMQEDQTGSNSGKLHVSLAGPNPEHMDDEFTEAEEEAVARESPQTFRNTNPCVSTSTGVIYKTNVRRPQLRSTQMKDKVVPNNSQVKNKKTEVEDHPRISNCSTHHSSKKLKGIQTLTPAEQEAADIMKALKESKKMSKRQPGTGGSNEGTGNILGVPDESTVISRASSEGTGSKPGVPDEEKLIL